MATKATPATTAANAISSVVTRAGSDTGYHLVSLRHAMHTVADTAWPAPDRPGPTGKFEAKSAGTMPSYAPDGDGGTNRDATRSEEHTSELQSLRHLVCRLLLEK